MISTLTDYYRCPGIAGSLATSGALSATAGYFRFVGAVCYGRRAGGEPAPEPAPDLPDVAGLVRRDAQGIALPFDLAEVVANLRQERYRLNGRRFLEDLCGSTAARDAYYFVRPLLQLGIRKHLQRIRLTGWERIPFPQWPVDTTVEKLVKRATALLLASRDVPRLPFIWFWPDGARACAAMTHDVEGPQGREFCGALMDLDDASGIKSSFQVVPEGKDPAWRDLCWWLRARGFEVNLHDLNHDGHLFSSRRAFLERVERINGYARELGCDGFRSGAMYRQQDWYDAFELSYDMSVPNVAHLDPQRGGCCTVLPYFAGKILELPLTTIQDYSLFHILGEYSPDLWQRQIDAILDENGLMTFLSHPDYLADRRARQVYAALLARLEELRARSNVWIALPGEIARWWRNRREMTLVRDGASWRIEGPDAARARLAHAVVEDGTVRYEVAEPVRAGAGVCRTIEFRSSI